MATHSSIFAWRITMDRGAWRATVHGVAKSRESQVAQSCPTLSDPMDCSLTGSFIHGIFQARVLEWGAIAFSVCQPVFLLKNLCWSIAALQCC